MYEMILMRYDSRRGEGVVLCPNCRRISRQALERVYGALTRHGDLSQEHLCPICGARYVSFSSRERRNWGGALEDYEKNPDAYERDVRMDYVIQHPTAAGVQNARRQEEMDRRERMAEKPLRQNPATAPGQQEPLQTAAEHADEELSRRIEAWKRELLDTGRRNRMINFRETRSQTLKILFPDAGELFNRMAFSAKPLTFQKPAGRRREPQTDAVINPTEPQPVSLDDQIGDIRTEGTMTEREKTLRNLREKTRIAQEEQGIHMLYLCFGFVRWRENDRENTPYLRSPLLMMPVTLGLKSLNAPFTLTRNDAEIEVNPTLDDLFRTQFHLSLPKFELKNRSSFESYMREMEQLMEARGWKLERDVYLGLLSFLKISMYHDLEDHREQILRHPVLRALSGDRQALGALGEEALQYDFDAVRPGDWYEVVDADSSQEEAILLSRLGVSFVMQGPPGTGKSQTITNIIAQALAEGKKVLFVSEKAAALEVVRRRMAEVHLDDFVLSLHSYKANRREILESIGANLRLEAEYTDPSERLDLSDLSDLFEERAFLSKYAHELHRPLEPLGESLYTALGKESKLRDAAPVSFRLDPPMQPEQVSREQLLAWDDDLNALEKALRALGGSPAASPWHGTKLRSAAQTAREEMLRATEGLGGALTALSDRVKAFGGEYALAFPEDWDGICSWIEPLEEAAGLPRFPAAWLDAATRHVLLLAARTEDEVQKGFRRALREIGPVFQNTVVDAPVHAWLTRADRIRDTYAHMGWEADELTLALEKLEAVKALATKLRYLWILFHREAPCCESIGLPQKAGSALLHRGADPCHTNN